MAEPDLGLPPPQISRKITAPTLIAIGTALLLLALALVTFFQVLPAMIALGLSFISLMYGFAAAFGAEREPEESAGAVASGTPDHRSALVTRLTWIASGVLTVFVLYSAILHLVGIRFVRDLYAKWGYPTELRWAVGVIELVACVALLIPRLATIAAVSLVPVMLGATYTLLFADHPVLALFPLLMFVLLLFVAWEQSGVRRLIGSHVPSHRH
jgi:uncharacterized membrane protein YphA (DoxX/SURF4 family)